MNTETFKFDDFNLDNPSEGYIVDFDLMWLNGNNITSEIKNAGGLQGVFSSPSYVRGRTLRINGLIRALTYSDLQDKIDTLKGIFSIVWNPEDEGTKEFYVKDANDIEWIADARISDDIEFTRDGTTAKYSVGIFISDSRYRSLDLKDFTGTEGIFGGVKLPFTLPMTLNESSGGEVVTTTGNVSAPLKVTITATDDINTVITVKNETTGDYFAFTATGESGDVFVIDSGLDSRNVSLTKNGENILSQKVQGSTWLSVLGSNTFNVFDTDDKNDFNTKFELYDRLS